MVVVLQAVFIAAQHSSVQAHDLGIWAFFSCLVTAVVVVAQASHVSKYVPSAKDAELILRIINGALLLPLIFACILLPRRPEVFYKGEKVDREWSTCALSRCTWTWASHLLSTAQRKGDLDEKDIPRPNHTVRVDSLVKNWNRKQYQGTLLRSLLKEYGARLAFQWIVIIIRCIIGIGPFWTMLRLVQMLESRDSGNGTSRELWEMVFLMGFLTLAEQVSLLPGIPICFTTLEDADKIVSGWMATFSGSPFRNFSLLSEGNSLP